MIENSSYIHIHKTTTHQPSGAREVTTIKTVPEAEMAGMIAGMDARIKREDIPEDFAQRMATREAWLEAFDKMRQSLRGVPVEAPKVRKAKSDPVESKPNRTTQEAPKVVEPEEPEEPETPKTMADILAERHHEAKEYA